MMGFQGTPARLFYDFCLDDHVPCNHPLRGVDRHLGLDDLRQSLKPFYSQMGRPSVDPELMIRMLIVGYCLAFGPSAASAKRFTSIWSIACSAGSDWMVRFPITRRSRRTDTGVFARATCCAAFSRAWCRAVSLRAWLAPMGLRSTPA
jgi:hypothetical protein